MFFTADMLQRYCPIRYFPVRMCITSSAAAALAKKL
jgi:hypothetical protein